MRSIVLAVFGVLLVLGMVAPAFAEGGTIETVWRVQPSTDPQELVTKPDELILRQRLLPIGAARLGADFVGPNGKTAFQAGTELFQIKSDVPIYCVSAVKEHSAFEKWVASGSRSQFCFVDTNSDNKFEAYFQPISLVPGLPTLEGKRPRKTRPMADLFYAIADPKDMKKQFWVGIQYQGKHPLYNRRNFKVSFGSDSDRGSLDDAWTYVGASFPATSKLIGAEFTALGLDGDNLRVKIDRQFPFETFAVLRTVKLNFY